MDQNAISPINQATTVYYRFENPKQRAKLPKIQPPGPGSIPGSGAFPDIAPSRGATTAQRTIFAASRPRLSDNVHQTILQSQSPPELRIKSDLKLPNLVVQNKVAPKMPLNFDADRVRPRAPSKKEISNLVPILKTTVPTSQFAQIAPTDKQQPRLAVPIGAAPAPKLPAARSATTGDTAAPEIGLAAGGASGPALLILGTQPSVPSTLVALPPGNRIGQFSIAPGGSGFGSPGGSSDGVAIGGTGGRNTGGNESAGVGGGNSGGGGGNSGAPGFVSLRGSGGASENLADPNPGVIESLVFALPKITGLRHSGIVVAAGPIGGGGLGVYGALHCGKIYTVSLPMSGKNWTLQFCQTPTPGTSVAVQTRSSVVHMETALIPPEAETRYDFKRLPIPAEKVHKLIILEGTILAGGTVENLKVREGLTPEMDAAAVRAFSQWTFKPAMRAGKPVSVDILVGIPAVRPSTESDVANKIIGDKGAFDETEKSN